MKVEIRTRLDIRSRFGSADLFFQVKWEGIPGTYIEAESRLEDLWFQLKASVNLALQIV